MVKSIFKAAICIILVLNSIVCLAAPQACKPNVEEYTVKNSVDMDVSRIEMGDVVNLYIEMKDSILKTGDISGAGDIEIINIDGSFGSPDADSIEITSSGGSALEYTVKFKNIGYSGNGSSIRFKVRYKSISLTSSEINFNVNECSETETNDNIDDSTVVNSTKTPYIEISRSDIAEPIKANETFNLTLNIKNRGSTELKRPSVTISLPDSIYSLEGMGNISIPNIKSGGSANVTLKLKAADYIASGSEEIDVIFNYNYGSGGAESGSYSDRIFVPMVATAGGNAPIIQITKDPIEKPIEGDSEFVMTVRVKNVGETDIASPVLTFTLPEEILPTDDSTSAVLPDIKAGAEIAQSVRLKTKKYLSQSSQEVTADLKFRYKSGNENTSGTESAKLIIPTASAGGEGETPLLYISSETPQSNLGANQSFNAKVTINNIGSKDINAAVLTWDAPDGIIISGKSVSVNVGAIKAGEKKIIGVSGKTGGSLTAGTLAITGELKYKYENGKTAEQASETIKLVIATTSDTAETNAATPNLIVDSYSYGGTPIANGSTFLFDVSFKNTSTATPVDNVVMTIDTGEGVSIKGASNTYYYDSLSAGGRLGENIEMQILPTAETGSVTLTVGFKYEYVSKGERTSATSSQNVSIPIYKPDKLEITFEPIAPATVGMEQTVTLNYVNKGKGEVSNVKAEIFGDVNALTSVQNLGNFEAGKSGTINFVVIPEMAGDLNFTVKISYEDPNMEQKVLEYPCVMSVEEYVDDMPMDDVMPIDEEQTSHKGIIIGGATGVVIILGAAVIIIRKRRRKKALKTVSVNWEEIEKNEDA